MKKKCNLNKLFKEFNVSVKRKAYGVTTFNGFIKAKNYNAHINEIVSNFKHDMCYQLAFENNAKKEVLLRNLNKDLNEKKVSLERKFKFIQRTFCRSTGSITNIIRVFVNRQNCRRIKYMYYKQKIGIDNLIEIVNISADSFNINLSSSQAPPMLVCNTKWTSGKLALIQLIVAHIYSNTLDTTIENEFATIKEIAQYFGVEYNHTLETSLIHSIFDRKDGYEPKIFEELKKGYQRYENLRKERNQISRS